MHNAAANSSKAIKQGPLATPDLLMALPGRVKQGFLRKKKVLGEKGKHPTTVVQPPELPLRVRGLTGRERIPSSLY